MEQAGDRAKSVLVPTPPEAPPSSPMSCDKPTSTLFQSLGWRHESTSAVKCLELGTCPPCLPGPTQLTKKTIFRTYFPRT